MATQARTLGLGRRPGRTGKGRVGAQMWAKGLPSGRAVVGGLLVAVAMLTVTLLAGRGGRDTVSVLVAAHDLPAGAVLSVGDLAATEIDVPDTQLQLLVQDPAVLNGTALARPLASGELVGSSDVVAAEGAPARSSVTLRLDPERALAGSIRAGEQVAVVATYDDCSTIIAARAMIIDIGGSSSDLGGQRLMVTLDLDSDAETVAVVNASETGSITLVRSNGSSLTSCALQADTTDV